MTGRRHTGACLRRLVRSVGFFRWLAGEVGYWGGVQFISTDHCSMPDGKTRPTTVVRRISANGRLEETRELEHWGLLSRTVSPEGSRRATLPCASGSSLLSRFVLGCADFASPSDFRAKFPFGQSHGKHHRAPVVAWLQKSFWRLTRGIRSGSSCPGILRRHACRDRGGAD